MVMAKFGNDTPTKSDLDLMDSTCFKDPDQCIFLNFYQESPHKTDPYLHFCYYHNLFAWNAARKCKGNDYISKHVVYQVLVKQKDKIVKYMERGYLRLVL